MTKYTDQLTAELLAVTEPDELAPSIDRARVREMLAEAWTVGRTAWAAKDNGRNPFNAPARARA